jgi:hypothetical protein
VVCVRCFPVGRHNSSGDSGRPALCEHLGLEERIEALSVEVLVTEAPERGSAPNPALARPPDVHAAPNTTNPAGPLGQAAGVAQSGVVHAPTVMSAVPQALESLAAPAATVSPIDLLPLLSIPSAAVSSVAIAALQF